MTECKKSFKDDDYRRAKVKAAYLNQSLELLFSMIRNKRPDNEELLYLIRTYFEKLLMDAEGSLWLDSEVWQEEYPIDLKERHDGKTPEQRIADLEQEYDQLKRVAIQHGHKERYRVLAMELLAWRGYEYHEVSPESTQLRREYACRNRQSFKHHGQGVRGE